MWSVEEKRNKKKTVACLHKERDGIFGTIYQERKLSIFNARRSYRRNWKQRLTARKLFVNFDKIDSRESTTKRKGRAG